MISVSVLELRKAFALISLLLVSACSSSVSTGSVGAASNNYAAPVKTFEVCSGYGCIYKDEFTLTKGQARQIARLMRAGKGSAKEERAAIRRAVARMEKYSLARLGFASDVRFSYQKHAGKRGQMDCVDESLNTTAYLKYLEKRGLLRHHTVYDHYATRGFILDGRYPHKSARIRDKKGVDWAVDSWKGNNGVGPQIITLKAWYAERQSAAQY